MYTMYTNIIHDNCEMLVSSNINGDDISNMLTCCGIDKNHICEIVQDISESRRSSMCSPRTRSTDTRYSRSTDSKNTLHIFTQSVETQTETQTNQGFMWGIFDCIRFKSKQYVKP